MVVATRAADTNPLVPEFVRFAESLLVTKAFGIVARVTRSRRHGSSTSWANRTSVR